MLLSSPSVAVANYLYKYSPHLLVYSELLFLPLLTLESLFSLSGTIPPSCYNTVLCRPSRTHLPSSNIGVCRVTVLALPNLPLPLADDVLNPQLVGVFLLEGADVTRVPKLGRDAEVLAAAHQGIGLAAFAGGRNRVFGEVAALATGLSDESTGIKSDGVCRKSGGE